MSARQPVSRIDQTIRREANFWWSKFPRGLYDVQDLIQEGELECLKAQQKFDATRSLATFDTFLVVCLRNRYRKMLAHVWIGQRREDQTLQHQLEEPIVEPTEVMTDRLLAGQLFGTLTQQVFEALTSGRGDAKKVARRLGLRAAQVEQVYSMARGGVEF